MFGLSFSAQLIQGSAVRTWNCVSHFAHLLWYKFYQNRYPVMPRSRRRHHSRSRSKSRSRSHSHDRERDPKRRKLAENYDSPHHRRSVSLEPTDVTSPEDDVPMVEEKDNINDNATESIEVVDSDVNKSSSVDDESSAAEESKKLIVTVGSKLEITPRKTMSPKQQQKKLESEKKRQERMREKEEREKKRQEEKEEKLRQKEEKQKQKLEKEEQKKKEREEKEELRKKEREEKEQKRKEKEEKEEAKRKEREQERLKKQQELEEKNREKQKLEEQKQKIVAAFVNFFVPKKAETTEERKIENLAFMPFEIKPNMKLAPTFRKALNNEEKAYMDDMLKEQDKQKSYLKDLKDGKKIGKSEKTFPYVEALEEDDVTIVEDVGESILEEKPKVEKLRAKYLSFHENRRPAYYGTWRKSSKWVKPRYPFAEDKDHFDYEVDSDDDWEEDEQGESITGSDDEDKDKENEEDDYEVDNEFFVPHGHLSDDEVDDEKFAKMSPESHKAKLKLLKNEFDAEMKNKTHKLKSRLIGCIWYKKDGGVDEAIDLFLKPLSVISNGQVQIKKRSEIKFQNRSRRSSLPAKELSAELVPHFLEMVHGNVKNQKVLLRQFLAYAELKGLAGDTKKKDLLRVLKQVAQWMKCPDEGIMFNKFCWYVDEDVRKEYGLVLNLPNKWNDVAEEKTVDD